MSKVFIYKENPGGQISFTVPGDYCAISKDENCFAVADSPLRVLSAKTRIYPYRYFGQVASQIFCDSVIQYLYWNPFMSEKSIKNALNTANVNIYNFNISIGEKYKNPEKYDMPETIGAVAKIFNGILYYGYLEDCYIEVLDKNTLKNKLPEKYSIVKSSKFLDEVTKANRLEEYVPKSLKEVLPQKYYYEACWCNYQRNNPKAVDYEGQPVGWGCFNGEKEAKYFYNIGSCKLTKGDHILIYTDGMIPFLKNKNLFTWFLKNAEPTMSFEYIMRDRIMNELNTPNIRKLGFDKITDDFELDLRGKDHEKTLIYIKY